VQNREMYRPRIPVTTLGEYPATNDAARRRRIIVDQKKYEDYITGYYTEVEEFLTDFLLGGAEDDEVLLQKVEEFYDANPYPPWQGTRNWVSAEALLAFLDIADELDLGEYDLQRGSAEPPNLDIQGVSVSVSPELTLARHGRTDDLFEGAVKLYINKTYPMSEAAGLYTATTLHQFVDECPSAGGSCDYRMCYVVDVFGGHIFTASRSYKQRRKSLEAACEEIRRAWPEY
jgi:hypothetical protein